MTRRLFNSVLLLIALAGIFQTWQTRSQLRHVRAEYDALANEYGLLEIRDPKKFYVRRTETDDPYNFAWRFYQPDQVALKTRTSSLSGGSGSSHSPSPAQEGIVRVRFRFEESGMGVFVKRNFGSSTFGMGNAELGEFLRTHWDELQIEAIGENETHEADVLEVMTFLSVRVPESLAAEAKATLGKSYRNVPDNEVLVLQIGTPEGFQQAEERDGSE